MIQAYQPVQNIEELTGSTVTDARLADGLIQYDLRLNGNPRSFTEKPHDAFRVLQITGASLTSVELKNDYVYYTLTSVEEAYIQGASLEREWWQRDGVVKQLTDSSVTRDGVEYAVLDGGQPRVIRETEDETLSRIMITGVRVIGAQLRDGFAYYKLAESMRN